MYSINYKSLETFHELENDWKELQDGAEMTYFQQYDWNNMLAELKWPHSRHYEIVFANVSRDNKPILIAPLFITKDNRYRNYPKGAYLFGNQGWSDYCNFIYKAFDINAVNFFLQEIKSRYGISSFCVANLKEESSLYNYLSKRGGVSSDEVSICVALDLPSSFEEYNQMLSKNAKQNIRTAHNRANKDGLTILYNHDEQQPDRQEFLFYKQKRALVKDKVELDILRRERNINSFQILINKLRKTYYKFINFEIPYYTPFEHDFNSHYLTVRNAENNELCASINYGVSSHRKEIVVMAIALNEKYNRYSPGMLGMYELITTQIQKKEFTRVDFTRGQENYKYVLGGISNNNHRISIVI